MEQLLALEMVRVTEAAAIASARFMGRGERDEADRAATEAMRADDGRDRHARHDRHRRGRARPGADALHRRAGGPAATTAAARRRGRHRGRPAGRHQPGRAPGRPTRSPSSRRRSGAAWSTPRTPTSRSCASGPVAAGHVDIRQSPTENLDRIAEALRRRVNDITVMILDRPRHEALIARGARGRRADQAHLRRRPVGGHQLRVSGTGVHAVMGIGGAPGGRDHGRGAALPRRRDPGPLPLPQRRGARARGARMGHGDEDRVYRTEDLAPGENLVFAATGVTEATCSTACASSAAAPGRTRW